MIRPGVAERARRLLRARALRAASLLGSARSHARHLVLAALVAGMLAAGSPLAVVALAALSAAAGGAAIGAVRPRPGIALACAAAVLAGASLTQARTEALDRTALRPLLGHQVSLRGSVLEVPRAAGRGPHANPAWAPMPHGAGARAAIVGLTDGPGPGERVLVRASRWPEVVIGDEVAVRGRLLRLRPGDGWLARRAVHARLPADAVRLTGRRRGGIAGALDRVRHRAERAVASGLDSPRAALARGMVLGQDDALDEAAREDFRASGLAHLLAASGQNVTLLVALALPLLSVLGLGLRGRLAGCLLLVALYVPLAGAGPSIQRAGVMGAAGIVAVLASRRASRTYALLLAAAVTLALDPRASSDPGWQLSFAAVAAIFAVAAPLSGALRARRVPGGAAEAAGLTVAATIGTAPLLAFHFGRLSLTSLPANLLAAPAVAPVMWLGMLSAAIGGVVPPAATLLNGLAQYPLAYLGALAHAAARAPGAGLQVRIPSVGLLVLAYATLATVVALLVRGGRGRRVAVAALVVLATWAVGEAALASRPPPPPDPRALIVSFLDVGQGDATLVQHAGATVLVDTGPPGSPLLRRLREAGVRRVDLLVVTHAQADHEGGTADVLRRLPVGLLLDGGEGSPVPDHRAILAAASERHVRRVVPDTGEIVRAGPIELRVLWPHAEPAAEHAGEDPNQRAIVAHVRVGDFDLLLPADAESDVTAGLDLPPVEALKVAHHGSADPGTTELLARLRPRIAVIEVGRGNPYGHPVGSTLAALRSVPAVYRTDRDGTVRLEVLGGALGVRTG